MSPSTHHLAWVSAIVPIGEPYRGRLSEHSDVEAWHAPVEFRPWEFSTETPKLSRKDTYGWKPQVQAAYPGLDRSVGEVELAQRLRSAGYTAYWVDNFGSAPAIWRPWTRRAKQLPRWLLEMDEKIRRHDLMKPYKTGGWPDVVAWDPTSNEALFVEYKGPGDKVKPSQDAWVRAAADLGVLPDTSYVVATWEPSSSTRLRLDWQKLGRHPLRGSIWGWGCLKETTHSLSYSPVTADY